MRKFLSRFARHLGRKNSMIQDSVHMFCFKLERAFFMVNCLYFSSYMCISFFLKF